MTIAAGFVCNNGVILGADTEITRSTVKTHESKIVPIDRGLGCYLSFSGDVYLMRQMVGRIRVALGCDLAFPPKPTADSCFETICSEYQASLKSQESKPPEEKGWLELLVTIRRSMHHLFKAERGYETSLYHIIGSHVLPVDRYAVIGIG